MELSLGQVSNSLLSNLPLELLLLIGSFRDKFKEYLITPPSLDEAKWVAENCTTVLITRVISLEPSNSGCSIVLYKNGEVFKREACRLDGSKIERSRRKLENVEAYLTRMLKDENHRGTKTKRSSPLFDVGTMFKLVKHRLFSDVKVEIVRERVIQYLNTTFKQLGDNNNYIVRYLYYSICSLNLYYGTRGSLDMTFATARLVDAVNEMV